MTRRSRAAFAAVLSLVLAGAAIGPVAAAKPGSTAGGKPGYPDRVTWSGETWQVKTSRSAVGPGPNVFAKENVSVVDGNLRLRISQDASGRWTCAEIIGPTSYGYGTYTFTLVSDVSALDPNVVLGLFTWSDKAQQAHREIDIEFAKWGEPADETNAQYVVQPHDRAGHLRRFSQPATTRSIHSFRWSPGSVEFVSRLGDGTLISSFTYTGSDVPTPADEKVRLNLWLFGGNPPLNGQPVEVVVESFRFAAG